MIKTATMAAVAGTGLTARASAQAICPTEKGDEDGPPAAVIVTPKDSGLVEGTQTIQIDAADYDDEDSSLTVEVSIDGGDWIEASYNDSTGYYEYEWETGSLADGRYSIDARVTNSEGDTGEANTHVVTVNNDAASAIIDDFERDEPLSDYGGATDAFSLETDEVYHGDQAIVQDSGGFAGIGHTEGYNEEALPVRGDEVHYYFKNGGAMKYCQLHLFAQEQAENMDSYAFAISGSSPSFTCWLIEDGGLTTMADVEFPEEDQIDGWYRLEATTDSSTVTAELYDAETDELLVDMSFEDDTYSSGGIGFRSDGAGQIFDTVVLNPTGTEIP